MIQMNTLDELLTKIKETPLALIYLSQPACSVCLADKPRLNKLALEKHVPLYAVNVAEVPEAAGQFFALSAPVAYTPLTLPANRGDGCDSGVLPGNKLAEKKIHNGCRDRIQSN